MQPPVSQRTSVVRAAAWRLVSARLRRRIAARAPSSGYLRATYARWAQLAQLCYALALEPTADEIGCLAAAIAPVDDVSSAGGAAAAAASVRGVGDAARAAAASDPPHPKPSGGRLMGKLKAFTRAK